MLWLNKITSGIKTLLKEHLISIVVFLVGMILAGIETDYIENLFIDLPVKAFQDELLFGTCFCLFLTPGILLVESHFKNKKQKIIHVLELLISFAVSGFYSWAETIGNKLENTPYADYEQYLTRAAIVYLILAVACTVYFLYKKSGETFEGYFYKAFVGVIRAVAIYIIMAIGILLIMHIFESLFFTTRLELLPEFVLMGIVGFPAGIYGISHVEEGDSGFSKVLFCYVNTFMLAAAFLVVYAYVIQIILTWTFPSNEAFSIMAGLFIAGLYVWTAAQGVTEGKLLVTCRIMPLLFAPLIIVQSMCLYMRVSEYGFTFSRYGGLFLILFEVFYVLYYLIRLLMKKGIGSALLIMIPAMIICFFAIPRINVYSVVTASQKKVVENFIARVEAKDDTAYDFSEKAESSYRELKMRSSIEGKKYVEALNVKYSDDVLNDLFDEYRYREEVQSKPYEYYKTEVRHAFVTIELSGYRYISPFYTTIDLSTDDLTKIDTSKIPARAKYNGAMVLGEADLSELISKLRVMDVAGAQNTELQNLIVDPIPVENGLLYLEDIKFEVDKKDESVVNKITIDGYCVYN